MDTETTVFHQQLFELAWEPMFVRQLDGTIIDWNQGATDLYGFSRDDAIGAVSHELLQTEFPIPRVDFEQQLVRDGQWLGELTHIVRNGRHVTVDSRQRLFTLSDCTRIVLEANRDITERKRSDGLLREREARLKLALEGAGMGTCDWNLTTDQVLWDERQFALFGIRPADFSGRGAQVMEMIHPEDRVRLKEHISHAKHQETFQKEFRVIHQDGTVHWLAGLGMLLPPGEDGTQHLISVHFDITTRKQEEIARERRHTEELARLYRIGTINELAGGLAHELSQPLTAIQNYAGGSLRHLQTGCDPLTIKPALEAITLQSQRVVDIIQHLRRLMVTGEPQRTATDVNAVVHRACELLKLPLKRKKVNLTLALAPELPKLLADALQIEQVLIILLHNCLDSFTGEHLANPVIELSTAAHDGGVEVTVSDNGSGVAPEVLPHLFEPFYTTKPKGLGLGLMLARSLLRAHNGTIRAHPKPDGGLTMRFTLPAEREQPS